MPPDGSMPSTAIGTARWQRLIPVAFITYSLAYVDRANYSIGSAAGLGKDLGITGQRTRCWARCSSSAISCSRSPPPGMPKRAVPSG